MFQKRQHDIAAAFVAVFLAALLALPVAADTLTINGEKKRNVLVVGYADGKLTVKEKGKNVQIPIHTVQQMELGGEDELNRAEKLAAKGDKGMVAAYEIAARKARGNWRPALMRQRLEMAKNGAFPIPANAPPPPEPVPASQPKPAETKPETKPEPETPKPPPDVDPTTYALKSARNLLEACKSLPADPRQLPNWKDLDEDHRKQELQAYETAAKQWNTKYAVREKTVTWTLAVVSVKQKNNIIAMELNDGEQIIVQATFAETTQKLPKLREGSKISVTGTLRSFTYQAAEKTIFMSTPASLTATLDDAHFDGLRED